MSITTIATHLGKEYCFAHNRRSIKLCEREQHIDLTREHEKWIDIREREAYNQVFGKAIQSYNEKQTRNDRKITDYISQLRNSKNGESPFYEFVCGIYESENNNNGERVRKELTKEQKQLNKEILKEFVSAFREKYKSNIFVNGAYYHDDEWGSPHIHLDFIAFGHYDKGLSVRNSFSKALKEMEYDKWSFSISKKKVNPLRAFCSDTRNLLQEICKKHGLTISFPDKHKKDQKHLDKNDYIIQEQNKKISSNNKILNQQKKDYDYNKGIFKEQRATYEKNKVILANQEKAKSKNINEMRNIVKEYDKRLEIERTNHKANEQSKDNDLNNDLENE